MARSGGPVQARFYFSARAFARPNPGPKNIKSGLNGVAMPPFGLILSGSMATASGVPLGALGTPKRPQILQKQRFSCFPGPGAGVTPSPWASLLSLRDAHCYCHHIVLFAGCRCVTSHLRSHCDHAKLLSMRRQSPNVAAEVANNNTNNINNNHNNTSKAFLRGLY